MTNNGFGIVHTFGLYSPHVLHIFFQKNLNNSFLINILIKNHTYLYSSRKSTSKYVKIFNINLHQESSINAKKKLYNFHFDPFWSPAYVPQNAKKNRDGKNHLSIIWQSNYNHYFKIGCHSQSNYNHLTLDLITFKSWQFSFKNLVITQTFQQWRFLRLWPQSRTGRWQ